MAAMTGGIFTIFLGVLFLFEAVGGVALKCKCDCPGSQLVCGKDTKTNSLLTFKNPCQVVCQNCTHNERWVIFKEGECGKAAKAARRSIQPPPPPPPPEKQVPGAPVKTTSTTQVKSGTKTLSTG